MYKNCEKTIKLFAKLCPVIMGIGLALIPLIFEFADMRSFLLGSLVAIIFLTLFVAVIGGGIGYLVGSFIYGFAEIVENSKKNDVNENESDMDN